MGEDVEMKGKEGDDKRGEIWRFKKVLMSPLPHCSTVQKSIPFLNIGF
jgi:hypothetical protein